MCAIPFVTTVTLHAFPDQELQGTVEKKVLLEYTTFVADSPLQAQEQVYVFGGGGLDEGGCGEVEVTASADPESASIAAMAAGQAILRRRRCI